MEHNLPCEISLKKSTKWKNHMWFSIAPWITSCSWSKIFLSKTFWVEGGKWNIYTLNFECMSYTPKEGYNFRLVHLPRGDSKYFLAPTCAGKSFWGGTLMWHPVSGGNTCGVKRTHLLLNDFHAVKCSSAGEFYSKNFFNISVYVNLYIAIERSKKTPFNILHQSKGTNKSHPNGPNKRLAETVKAT